MIEYGLKDEIRIKKNEVIMILYSFTPSDMSFQTILMPKVILANFLSYLKYALIQKLQTKVIDYSLLIGVLLERFH